MKTTLSLLVENKFGVLCRVAGLMSGRGFNIDSLNVTPTIDPTMSRMTIVVDANETAMEQVIKQLNKVVDVIKVIPLEAGEFVKREMALLKLKSDPQQRAQILREAEIFRAKVVDATPNVCILEATGDESKIDAFIQFFKPYGILEVARTGPIAMQRGGKADKRLKTASDELKKVTV
jgi:acetolactate synthase I/III small subunit